MIFAFMVAQWTSSLLAKRVFVSQASNFGMTWSALAAPIEQRERSTFLRKGMMKYRDG